MPPEAGSGPGDDPLHPYYRRELSYLRQQGRLFRADHLAEADALELADDECRDPHIERLLQSFALLTARIQHRLDDDFPELTDGLLGVLYPHYQAPIPSMGIIQFQLSEGEAELAEGLPIETGTMLETGPEGEGCKYRTCAPVRLLPLRVVAATLSRSSSTENPGVPEDTQTVLRIQLETYKRKLKFSQLKLDKLRFHLDGDFAQVMSVYELLFRDSLALWIANAAEPARRHALPLRSLRPVGFDDREAILPFGARSLSAYRLLAEYFAFPRKFCGFEVLGLDSARAMALGTHVEIGIAFRGPRTDAKVVSLQRDKPERLFDDLERSVRPDMFHLGCAPAVNLFDLTADGFTLDHTRYEHPLVANQRRRDSLEIYSVDKVMLEPPGGASVEFQPFYAPGHSRSGAPAKQYYLATRRAATVAQDQVDHGTEVSLSFVDLDLRPTTPLKWTVRANTTCCNRNRPNYLEPKHWGQLTFSRGESKVSSSAFLRAPTPTLRPPGRHGMRWRLVSHLLLNHHSIADISGDPRALREIVQLYDHTGDRAAQDRINGLLYIGATPVVSHVSQADQATDGLSSAPPPAVARGLAVKMVFNRNMYPDNGLFLFASVLERFLSLYVSMNSFTQLRIMTREGGDEGKEREIHQWPPRAGEKQLI